MQDCLDIIDSLRINELDEKTKALYDNILSQLPPHKDGGLP